MKNFLQNLLIFLALCLCVLIAFQWDRETKLQKEVQALNDKIHEKMESIQSLQVALRRDEEEIKRLDGLKNELSGTVKSNRMEIAELKRNAEKAEAENERYQKQIEAYKTALQQANDSIKAQNEDIKKQNEDMKNLATERNETAAKFNKLAEEYNDLVKKWNELQQTLSKTNAPPAK